MGLFSRAVGLERTAAIRFEPLAARLRTACIATLGARPGSLASRHVHELAWKAPGPQGMPPHVQTDTDASTARLKLLKAHPARVPTPLNKRGLAAGPERAVAYPRIMCAWQRPTRPSGATSTWPHHCWTEGQPEAVFPCPSADRSHRSGVTDFLQFAGVNVVDETAHCYRVGSTAGQPRMILDR
jgi:hypothetical protein